MSLSLAVQRLRRLSALPLRADAVRTLLSAAEYRRELLSQIAAAKQRICLCSLYLQDDEAGADIMAALYAAKAARPALDIMVLVDWHRARRGLIGAVKTNEPLGNAAWYVRLSAAHAAAIPIYGVPVQTSELFGVMHLKGSIIDDSVLYSGAGINNVYLHQFERYRHDRYLLLDHAALATSMIDFVRAQLLSAAAVRRLDLAEEPASGSQIRSLRASLKRASYQFQPQNEASRSAASLSVTPIVGVGKNNRLNRVICDLLAASTERITLLTPYFNFPAVVDKEIRRAFKRGVIIDLIVGDKTANDFFIAPEQPFKVIAALPYLYEVNLRRFAKSHQAEITSGQCNLFLWKDGNNSFHLKGIDCDGVYTLLTGNNLNPRAFRLDLENALLIHDPQKLLQAQRHTEFESILQHAQRLSNYQELQTLPDYPAPVRRLLNRLTRVRLDRLACRVL